MANYHLEIQTISRGKGRSVTNLTSYICGSKLHDDYQDKTYYHYRQDVLYHNVFHPDNIPAELYDLQSLCSAMENAEQRYDARTAREFKGSLPNELPLSELVQIVSEFIETNFLNKRLCAIAAIHEGKNEKDPSRNNPHVHIIVSTRTVEATGFSKMKYREHNKRKYITIWREQWANVQNQAYKRNGLDLRVSHESLMVQGCHRKPLNHLTRIDWQREQRGERTFAGDRRREIITKNQEQELHLAAMQCRNPDLER